MAGATSWFSLRRRTPGRYMLERVTRLFVPYVVGVIVLTPIEAFLELTHKGWWKDGSLFRFIASAEARSYFFGEYHRITPGPQVLGDVGYHLWFVAFLFLFALIALPLFQWLKQGAGTRLISFLAGLAERRGGLLVFVFPLIAIRLALQPYFPRYTGWADFGTTLTFFVYGYILMTDARLTSAVRRDWLLYLLLGIACALFFLSEATGVPVLVWMGSPGTTGFFITWAAFALNSWCWTLAALSLGMARLNFANAWLEYFREASYPFFWLHHAVVFFVSFYVVQWDLWLSLKMLIVVIGSFFLTLGLYELLVRHINPVRALFGMRRE
jgi:hypothetical protein